MGNKICQRCKKLESKYKIKNKDVILLICSFCEESGDELIEDIGEKEQSPLSISDGTYGRLHIVKKSKKESTCRICKCNIPIGSTCYNQRLNLEKVPFPIQTRLCENCSQDLIKQGVEVAK